MLTKEAFDLLSVPGVVPPDVKPLNPIPAQQIKAPLDYTQGVKDYYNAIAQGTLDWWLPLTKNVTIPTQQALQKSISTPLTKLQYLWSKPLDQWSYRGMRAAVDRANLHIDQDYQDRYKALKTMDLRATEMLEPKVYNDLWANPQRYRTFFGDIPTYAIASLTGIPTKGLQLTNHLLRASKLGRIPALPQTGTLIADLVTGAMIDRQLENLAYRPRTPDSRTVREKYPYLYQENAQNAMKSTLRNFKPKTKPYQNVLFSEGTNLTKNPIYPVRLK